MTKKIINYEKKYKEALERTKSWARGEHPECFTEAQKAAEFIFPELAESEDEKVRKELIQFIKNWKDPNNIGRPHDFPTLTRNVEQCDRYIAWLEKQGEQRSKLVDFDYNANDSDLQEVTYFIPNGFHVEMDGNKVVIKRGKKKTADNVEPKWTADDEQYLLVCKNALRKYQVSDKWDADIISKWLEDKLKQGEQKLKWSKEDERAIGIIKVALTHPYNMDGKYDREFAFNWLKSLKQRLQ